MPPAPPRTPALVCLRDTLEANLSAMQSACDAAGVRLRAHGKMHKCSAVARLQVARGAVGLCCQTADEAHAFVAAGIADVLVTAPVAAWALPGLAALARDARVALVADSADQIARAAAAARSAGTVLGLVVDADGGLHRAGAEFADVPRLAAQAAAEVGLRYEGVQIYLGHLQHLANREVRRAACAANAAAAGAMVDALRAAGLAPGVVTGGGTGTYAHDLEDGLFTELQAGSYAFMDAEYVDCGAPGGGDWSFAPALLVAATVVSARHKTHVVTDAGLKALATDGPSPRVWAGAAPGSRWQSMGDEHGAIMHPAYLARLAAAKNPLAEMAAIDADPACPWPDDAPREGDTVWLLPGHIDPTVNLYPAIHAWDGRGYARWAVDARRA